MIAPYYQHDNITIYHGDCRDILPQLEIMDCVVTDPPYGLTWGATGFSQQVKTDWRAAQQWDERPSSDTLRMVTSAAKEWIIWGGNYFASDLGDCKAPLVWDKQTGDNYFADGEIAFTSFKIGTLRIFRHQWCGAFKASERGTRNVHPTQKPVALMTWSIQQIDNHASVLDPFCGSGSVLRAAKNLRLVAVGIDTNERYCEIAANRLSQEVLDFDYD